MKKKIQAFAKGKKVQNTIRGDQNNKMLSSFEGLYSMGKYHFQYLFNVEDRVSIVEVINMT